MRKKDLIGVKFGKLSVIAPEESKNGKTRWLCECECGKQKIICTQDLGKNTNSCGCLQKQNRKEIHITHNTTASPASIIASAILNLIVVFLVLMMISS